jgi:5-methylcytosine-specific restriction endonuclease McrA
LAERERRIGHILNEPKSHRRRKGLVSLLSDGTLTKEKTRDLLDTAKDCPYCGVRLVAKTKTVDHIIPISKGGAHSLANAIVCCFSCNSRKSDKDFDVWLNTLAEDSRKRLAALYRRRFGVVPAQTSLQLIYCPSKAAA